jgi:hypothetical protein
MLTLYALTTSAQTPAKAPAQGGMDKMAVEKALIANEQKINDAVVKGDVAAFKALVATDGLAIDENGPSAVADFEKMIAPGMAKITDMKLDNFKVMWVSSDVAIVTYNWTGKGTVMDMPVKPTYSSTVYAQRGGKWLAVFHQESVKNPNPPPAMTPAAAPAKKK